MLDLLPQCSDPDLERAIVALLIADNEAFKRVATLRRKDFSDTTLGAIYDAMQDVHGEGRPVNLVTLKSRLEGMRIDEGTGLDVVRSLAVAGSLPPIEDIVRQLKALAEKRDIAMYLATLAIQIGEDAKNATALAADGVARLNDFIAAMNAEARKDDPHLFDASQAFLERLQADDDPVEIPTGIAELDAATGGWHRGQFAILGGRPSMGKSALMLSSALRTALKGYGVLIFSLEMTMDQIVARALTDFGYTTPVIAYSDLKPGKVNQAQIRRLYEAAETFKGMPIHIDTQNGLTVADIQSRAQKVAEQMRERGTPLALVVVDHLLKIRPSSRYSGNPVKELDEVSEAMCVMAKSLDVAVVGLHQLNRGVESRDNPRPVMSDLRGSGSLEQDADVVLFVYRPAYIAERQAQEGSAAEKAEARDLAEKLKHKLELQIAKQRNGPTQTLDLWVDMSANVIRSKDWRR